LELRPAGAGESSAVNPRPSATPGVSPNGKISTTTSGGLHTIIFDTSQGQVRVNLPDDMRAGDTISGTVTAEPKRQTEDERKKNLETLKGYTITLWPNPTPNPNPKPKKPGEGIFRLLVKEPSFTFILPPNHPSPAAVVSVFGGFPGFNAVIGNPINPDANGNFGGADALPRTGSVLGGILPGVVMANFPPPSTSFAIPPIGQQGRPLEIPGPFDGNASNTTVRFGPVGSTVPDFEKNTERVSGGFGLIRPLAESPRKIVFECPSNVTGPLTILVKEGDGVPTTGTMRNVGVQLSAPKTNLMRGEKTIVTIEVSGLAGIIKDVPLQLDSKGVITMEGGSFQNLRIKPEEVSLDGRYKTTRTITGVQAGGFGVTATVIVGPFDLNLQDDTDPNRLFHFNSFTGDYIFACGGGSCRGGSGGTNSQPPTGSSAPPPPVTLTGIGKPAMKGCIITLSHNAPDRRVFARLDACTKSGDAAVETKSPKANFNITDKNTADNTAASPPK